MPYYLPKTGGRIIGFIPFPRVLVLCEMQSVLPRIWTRVAVFISYDDNHCTFLDQSIWSLEVGSNCHFLELWLIELCFLAFWLCSYAFLALSLTESGKKEANLIWRIMNLDNTFPCAQKRIVRIVKCLRVIIHGGRAFFFTAEMKWCGLSI